MKTRKRPLFRIPAVVLLVAFLLASGAGALRAGVCYDAFKLCLLDPINQATLTGSLYCLNGYYFCLKYVGSSK